LNVLHLRAAYFMENNLAAIGMIHGMGIIGNALLPDLKLPMIAMPDVGDYAAQRFLDLDFSGKQTRELLGERDLSMAVVTAAIARGIGKPDLRYEQFPYDQVQQVLTQMGIPPKTAALYIEMYKAINAGVVAPQEPRCRRTAHRLRLKNLCRMSLRLRITGRLPPLRLSAQVAPVAPVCRREFREAAAESCRCGDKREEIRWSHRQKTTIQITMGESSLQS
jgi:hypothetical protein